MIVLKTCRDWGMLLPEFVLPLQGNGYFGTRAEGVALGYGVRAFKAFAWWNRKEADPVAFLGVLGVSFFSAGAVSAVI
jgi:hypothetical protein